MDGLSNAPYRTIETRRIAGSLGAEVHGVDLSQPLPPEVVAEVRRALLDHLVIFFRKQDMTPERLMNFGRCFGDLHRHPYIAGMPGFPDVLELAKKPGDKRNFGGDWHTDQMFAPKPAMGTMLWCKTAPEAGGDTLFANMYLAYDTLSDGMKKLLGTLRGVAVGDKKRNGQTRAAVNAATVAAYTTLEAPPEMRRSAHPLVRTHPETGRRSLFIGGHVHYLEDMTEEESAPLIDFLYAHAQRPEFTCRFRWEEGSLAFWDNRCTMHFAINDYPPGTRVMHRVTVAGGVP